MRSWIRSYDQLEQHVLAGVESSEHSVRERVLNWLLRKQLDGHTDSVLIGELYTLSLAAEAVRTTSTVRDRWKRPEIAWLCQRGINAQVTQTLLEATTVRLISRTLAT